MDALSARMPILGPLAAAGLLAGTLVCLHIAGTVSTWVALFLCVVGALLWCIPSRWVWVGALIFGFASASLHVSAVRSAFLPSELEGKVVHVRGHVENLPIHEDGRRSFLFRVDDDVSVEALRGRIIRLGWYGKPGQDLPIVHAGSRWSFRAKLKRPHSLRNPGTLDSERTAFAQRVIATGSIVRGNGNALLSSGVGIESLRDDLGLAIDSSGQPAARFIRALAVGDTRAIEDADWMILRANGLTHLIAISGSHVAMAALLGVFFASVLWKLYPSLGSVVPRKVAAPVAGALVAIGYTLLAGGEVPTVRTLLMMWCVAGALLLRRRLGVAHALSAAAITLILIDPLNVLRPGFWLSFIGVAWLAWCLQGLKQGAFKEMMSAQFVATIGLLPLCIAFFGQTSWIAPLANLIAVPLWGLVIVPLSIGGVALNAVWPAAAQALWSAAASLFQFAWPVFEHMAQWHGAQISIPEASPWSAALALLAAIWLLMPRGVPLRLLSFALWLPLLAPAMPRAQAKGMVITFIDVGQGLSVLVQTQHHAMLYDAGPKVQSGFGRAKKDNVATVPTVKTRNEFDAGEKVVLPALAALGIRKLDMLMLSHGDADHAGGAAAVMRAFNLKDVRAPQDTPVDHTSECAMGDVWVWDGVRFEVLAPLPGMPYDGNGSSCVLKITSGYGKALLTGDVEAGGEAGLVTRHRNELKADVVSMPHHGSNSSSTYAFVRAVSARYAVASSGYRNMFKHPRSRVWTRWADTGAQPINTPASGAVRFSFSENGIEMTQERSRRARAWDTMEGDGVDGGSGLSYGDRVSHIPQYQR